MFICYFACYTLEQLAGITEHLSMQFIGLYMVYGNGLTQFKRNQCDLEVNATLEIKHKESDVIRFDICTNYVRSIYEHIRQIT